VRVFLSGNEELARTYLPIVKARAESLASLSKKRGLLQNAESFSFAESGTSVSIQYAFGQLQVSISSPFSTEDVSRKVLKSERETLVWIRTFDDLVFGSYNGMFFDLNSFILPAYEPPFLAIADVEKQPAQEHASVAVPASTFDSWSFYNLNRGLSSSLYLGALSYVDTEGRPRSAAVNVVDGVTHGYHPSCFYSESLNSLKWKFGGDVQYPDLEAEISGSDTFSYSSQTYAICSYHVKDPNITTGIGFPKEEFRSRILSAAATLSPPPPSSDVDVGITEFLRRAFDVAIDVVERAPAVYPNGWIPEWDTGKIATVSEYMYVRLDAQNVSVNANMVEYRSPPEYLEEYWDFDVIVNADVSLKISMIESDGTVVHDSIPLYNESGYTIYGQNALTVRPGFPNWWGYGGGRAGFAVKSFYVPSSMWAAKRNFIQLATTLTWVFDLNSPMWFVGMAHQAFAYRKETGWLPCSGLSGTILYDDEAEIFLCARWSFYNGYYPDFSLVGRNLDGDHYIFNAIFNFRGDWRKSSPGYYGFPDVRFILNKNGSLFSLHGAYNAQNGVYRITKSNATLLHAYTVSEIEPVFMSDDGDVLVTKSKIYLNGRVIECTECCGIFLDYTHFVDKTGEETFVIKKILYDSEVIVDVLEGQGHNFYELSEDSSVCIISRYYTSEANKGSVHYAVVVDFADPVYKFELSDQVINQFMNPEIFNSPHSDKLGYPTIIPYGARYVTACSCLKQYSGSAPSENLTHYVYNPMPGGTTLLKTTGDVCPMNNVSISGVLNSKRPTFPSSKAIVPQYHRATVQRGKSEYGDKRLNKFIYHHTGRILRRISDGLFPFERIIKSEVEIDGRNI